MMSLLRPIAGRLIRFLEEMDQPEFSGGMQFAIVIPLADEVARQATNLQLGILRELGRNPGLDAWPHITLKLGFPAVDSAPLEQYIAGLAAEVPPFGISLRDFGFFDGGIMFLDVEANPRLESLRRRILSDLSALHGIKPEEIEDSRFHFHVTLAHGLPKREFAALRDSFATRAIQLAFEARHIDLICHTGRQWVTCRREPLRGEPSHAT